MTEIFGVPVAVILGQLMLGLVNGSSYALLSLGLAVIFGLMGVVNFAHGAFYALGAFAALLMLQHWGVNYWAALLLSPLLIGLLGVLTERALLRRLYRLDPIYGLLLTFGLALVVEGLLHQLIGASGQTYPVPHALTGTFNLGFMVLPIYRAWVILISILVCFSTWFVIERTRVGATLRAATSLGYDIERYRLLAFVLSATLAGLAGSLKALVLGFVTLSDVLQSNSGEVILMTLVGGAGTFFGPVIGTALVVVLEEYLSDMVSGWVTVIVGGVFIVCVLVFRRGIIGELLRLRGRVRAG